MKKEPGASQKERELRGLHERELADLEVESRHGPRPLEGLSGASTTTWTADTVETEAAQVHGHDEARSRAASELQVEVSTPRTSRQENESGR